jgi:hypothetical protein
LTVVAAPLEDLIAEAVLFRLNTPELADALAGRAKRNTRTSTLGRQLDGDRVQLDELAQLYGAKEITAREWLTARNPIEARIRSTERTLAQLSDSAAIHGLPGQGQQLRIAWNSLNLTRQHAIVAAVLDHATVMAGSVGARSLDPNRVTPHWRL